jgi:UPF0716 family protein affecting phage T7 exclusion
MSVALAVLLAVLVLAAAGALLAWERGWDALGTLRATLAEAGERTAEAALEFWDWVRLGR